jgi:starch phosphorylase
MARLTAQYSASRTVREYTEDHYIPAAVSYNARAAEGGKLGAELLTWEQTLNAHWNTISFGSLKVQSSGAALRFDVPVHLGEVDPAAVQVELFAAGRNGAGPVRKAMDRGVQSPDGWFTYSVSVADDRPAGEFTPRVIPHHAGASVPLEAGPILWQK